MCSDVGYRWTSSPPADLRNRRAPEPTVGIQSVLEANFDLKEAQSLPYDVLDATRAQHAIDLTGLNLSTTKRGNLYRSYVLMRGVV
eukprot:5700693-Lingulodinium_polyedra.AAC.1